MRGGPYAFVVRCTVDPNRRDEFVAELNVHAGRALREEPGTLRFDVAIDPVDGTHVYLHEVYVDEAAFQHHFDRMSTRDQPWKPYVTAPPVRICIGTIVSRDAATT